MTLHIAIVADIHHGAPSLTKRGDRALDLMDGFASFVKDTAPDLVLDLGDRISDVDHDTDLRLEREVAEAFKQISVPTYHINGNHDRDHLTVAENEEILGQPLLNELIDLGDWQLALWRADSKFIRDPQRRGFDLPEPDLLWLSRTVQSLAKPTLIASHVPVSGHSQIGNYYFQRNPAFSTYPQAARVRAALAQATQPIACLAGHVHWNTVTQMDGIPHLTQQSLTESFTTQGEPAEAWGLLKLSDTLCWEVFGKDPLKAEVTSGVARWTPPLAPL